MRSARNLFCFLGLSLVIAPETVALAQANRNEPGARSERQPGRRGQGGREGASREARGPQQQPGQGPAALIARPEVQADLKLSASQKTAIEGILRDVNQARERGTRGNRGPGAQSSVDPSMIPDDAQVDAAIAAKLDAKQRQRLHQLTLREAGVLALLRPEVIDRLQMTEDQVAHIQDVVSGSGGTPAQDQAINDFGGQQVTGETTTIVGEVETTTIVNEDGSIDIIPVPNAAPMPRQNRARPRGGNPQGMSKEASAAAMQSVGQVLRKKQREAFNRMLGEPLKSGKQDEGAAPKDAPKSDDPAAQTKPTDKDENPPAKKPARKSLRDRRKAS